MESTRRSCCCPSLRCRPRRRWSRTRSRRSSTPRPASTRSAKAVAAFGGRDRLSVHLKIDTGMHRVGCDPAHALALVERIDTSSELDLAGVCTHLAVADEPDDPYTGEQLACFTRDVGRTRGARLPGRARARGELRRRPRLSRRRATTSFASGSPCTGSRRHRRSRTASRSGPALSLHARVMMVRELDAGARLSYGLKYRVSRRGPDRDGVSRLRRRRPAEPRAGGW